MYTLQRTNAKNLKQIFPEKELLGHSHNFHNHVSVSDLYIPTIDLPILREEICGPILGIYKSLTVTCMNVEIWTEATQFPEKENINGIFVAVQCTSAFMVDQSTNESEGKTERI